MKLFLDSSLFDFQSSGALKSFLLLRAPRFFEVLFILILNFQVSSGSAFYLFAIRR